MIKLPILRSLVSGEVYLQSVAVLLYQLRCFLHKTCSKCDSRQLCFCQPSVYIYSTQGAQRAVCSGRAYLYVFRNSTDNKMLVIKQSLMQMQRMSLGTQYSRKARMPIFLLNQKRVYSQPRRRTLGAISSFVTLLVMVGMVAKLCNYAQSRAG